MKKFLVLIMVAAAMISCRKMPDMSGTDGKYFVYTAYDREADFSSFSTFHIADSVLVMGSGGAQYADASESRTAAEIIRFYEDCMTARGYVSVDNKYDADLGLYISYVEEIHNVTGFVTTEPYWWWGYPGYWSSGWWGGSYAGWAPYAFPVSYSYSTHSFLTEMVDLTPLTGNAETDKDIKLEVVWNSYLDGSLVSGYNIMDTLEEAIVQSFGQTPALGDM